MAFKSKYTGQEIENILDKAKDGGNVDLTSYATKDYVDDIVGDISSVLDNINGEVI